MAMLKDEAKVVKSTMMKLNDETALLVFRQYHTETNEFSKVDRSKSKYRWLARVIKIENIISSIKWMREDANRLQKCKWPNDPWPWYLCIEYPENYKVADWLAIKLKKIKSWEDGQKQLAGWETKTKTRPEGFNKTAAYETEGYHDEAGNIVSLTNRESLLKLIGQNLIKEDSKN